MATKRVRIAVAMQADGEWSSAGWSRLDNDGYDSDMRINALETLDDSAAVHFIEADIPIPESQTIQGEVSERSDG